MSFSKILIIVLFVLAGAGLVWSVMSFINNSSNALNNPSEIISLERSEDNFKKAVEAELLDKCIVPEGYTDEGWQEHMSHHPGRYEECFTNNNKEKVTEYYSISADDLSDMLKHKDFTLIDVHIPEQNHIPGTDTFIPYNQIVERLTKLPQDKQAKLVVYCRSGSMSSQAAKELKGLGYANVYNLEGGVIEWQKQGYDVENKSL